MTPGSCLPAGGAATLPPVGFGQLSRVCTSASGNGRRLFGGPPCVRVARAPSGSHGPCVLQATDSAVLCPASYTHAHVTMPSATSFSDSRGCTSCGCADPTGASCTGSATLFGAAGCGEDAGSDAGSPSDAGDAEAGGNDAASDAASDDAAASADAAGEDAEGPPTSPVTLPADGTCHSVPGATFTSTNLDSRVTSQGACTPTGGQPSGDVVPKNQTVYCCVN